MIECGPGFCIEPITQNCTKIEGDFFGKDYTTNNCILDVRQGYQYISECKSSYCKILESDNLWHCGLLH